MEKWGYLINPDKTPTLRFERLLLGIANYIIKHVAPWDIQCLTPTKLANFVRLVGGDYDTLFLDTPSPSLSFIFTSLGCSHSLQPEKDPFVPPSVPALTPQGFVRWQMVQLLLEPGEHVPLLQQAVKRFELVDPVDGARFPRLLPAEALPGEPDESMVRWHGSVSEMLMLEAVTTRKSLRNGHSHKRNISTDTSLEASDAEGSVIDNFEHQTNSRHRLGHSVTMPLPQRQWKQRGPPQGQLHRRRSLPEETFSPYQSTNTRNHGDRLKSPTFNHVQRRRVRTPSSASESSASSLPTDDGRSLAVSNTPSGQAHQRVNQRAANVALNRPHTTNLYHQPRYFIPPHDLRVHANRTQPRYVQPFDVSQAAPHRLISANAKGEKVRWRDGDKAWDDRKSGNAPGTPSGQLCRGVRFVEATGDVGHNEQKTVSPVRGVGGRKYATIPWQ